MEITLNINESIIVSHEELEKIYQRLYNRVKAWAKKPSAIYFTLTQNLRNVYKRLMKKEDFERLNPWHVECIILLSKRGINIPPELLARAVERLDKERRANG